MTPTVTLDAISRTKQSQNLPDLIRLRGTIEGPTPALREGRLNQYLIVPADSGVWVGQVPCDNCDGKGYGAFGPQGQLVAPGGGKYSCPLCGGSGGPVAQAVLDALMGAQEDNE